MSKEGQGPGQPPKTPCPGEKVQQDLQVLMQKVGGKPEVLLIGETLGGKDIHSLMGSFVKDLFSTTCHPISPTDVLKSQCNALCPSGAKPQQLVFFLCRASCVKGKQAELQKILKEVKQFVQKAPCALVGIIMEPEPGEAAEARGQLEKLMRGIFPKAPQKKARQTIRKEDQGKELEEVQVEVEIYVPGQPKGKLAVMKAVCRASEALSKCGGATSTGRAIEQVEGVDTGRGSSWKSVALKSLLGITFVGGLAAAGWYLYDQGLIPSNIIPTNFIPSNLFSFARA
ncbi:uncharacterized protein LOC125445529 [Sphaerodactylus townsendi]|uniref:uncharacterized protein LOC125445529 n=1 Tax=Sphaerodactylus townsendi TaxID=933632 RepID=UPI002026195C|nr:uncharacterized protein LOC125445529 [Sphaerodactylus townsendi]